MDLKQYLKGQDIRIYHLAKAIGMPRTTLKDIVNGRTDISDCRYSTLQKIASYLEIPVDILVEEEGKVYYPETARKARRLAKNNRQGHTGVCRNTSRGDFRAYIKFQGKNIQLGTYKTVEEAIAAREAAERICDECCHG